MKKNIKVFFAVLIVIIVIGVVFCIVDTLRVHGDEDPIFTFAHKIIDYADYSAKVDTGLGYKIIRFQSQTQPEVLKIGTIFMSEKSPYENEENKKIEEINVPNVSGESFSSGESGDTNNKVTTFGEKYKDTIWLEGMEEEINAQNINSKLGYSMEYYYELFDYIGYEGHDKYIWNQISGDTNTTMTVYDITDEKLYQDSLEKIGKEKNYEEISGEGNSNIQKAYYRTMKEDEIQKVNYIYIIWIDNLKIMVDLRLPLEAEEGIGQYMRKMVNTITISEI